MPTDRPTDAEVLAEALWLSRLLLSEPLYQGNGEESEVAEQAGQFLRQVADRLSAPSSEEDAKRYQTAPSVSSAGAGDTQVAEDAVGWRPIDSAPKDRCIWVWCPPHDGLSEIVSICQWHDDAGFCVDEIREPKAWKELLAPAPPAQGKPA